MGERVREQSVLDLTSSPRQDLDRCRAALRAMASRVAQAQDEERHRIARGLHDDVGQLLATAQLQLHQLRRGINAEQQAAVDSSRRLIADAIQSSRALTFELVAPALSEMGLQAALDKLAERFEQDHAITCLRSTGGVSLPITGEAAATIYRVVRELLNNVAKHAQATTASVSLALDDNALRITVIDNGIGFEPAAHHAPERDGVGLLVARERVAEYGGTIIIDSDRALGTRIEISVPYDAVAEQSLS